MTLAASALYQSPQHRNAVLRAIALFKLAKVALLLLVAFGANRLLHGDFAELLEQWAATVRVESLNRAVVWMINQLLNVDHKMLEELQVGSLVFALLFVIEGMGLWFERRWAEYLTVVMTASLIPFEIYELVRHATALKVIVLMVNIAVMIFLIIFIRRGEPRRSASP
jgi:uncharacterized membrane protein (DUF2068 family)